MDGGNGGNVILDDVGEDGKSTEHGAGGGGGGSANHKGWKRGNGNTEFILVVVVGAVQTVVTLRYCIVQEEQGIIMADEVLMVSLAIQILQKRQGSCWRNSGIAGTA